jgi:hypothetical protein
VLLVALIESGWVDCDHVRHIYGLNGLPFPGAGGACGRNGYGVIAARGAVFRETAALPLARLRGF